jgi:hypothetical protein
MIIAFLPQGMLILSPTQKAWSAESNQNGIKYRNLLNGHLRDYYWRIGMHSTTLKSITMLALLSALFILAGCQEQPEENAQAVVGTQSSPAELDMASVVAETAAPKVGDAAAVGGECAGECNGVCEDSCGGGQAAAAEGTAADGAGGGTSACSDGDSAVGCAKEAAGAVAPESVPDGCERVTLAIENMDCPGKSGWINKTLSALEGISGCYADNTALTAVVDFDPALWDPRKLIAKLDTDSESFFKPTVVE